MARIIYTGKDSSYLLKKHFCPNCKTELRVVKVSKTVNSNSEESHEIPKMFSKTILGERGIKFRTYNYLGDIKYVCEGFECEQCKHRFTVDEIKLVEGEKDVESKKYSTVKIKKVIFNKILPIVIFILVAIIQFFTRK